MEDNFKFGMSSYGLRGCENQSKTILKSSDELCESLSRKDQLLGTAQGEMSDIPDADNRAAEFIVMQKYKNEQARENPKADSIYNPEHYTRRSPQPIEVIEAWGLDFWLGQVVKYVGRAGFKDGNTELEDLKKARFYLDRKINILKAACAKNKL